MPICHVLLEDLLRLREQRVEGPEPLGEPSSALTVGLYSDDWAHLKSVMIEGTATFIGRGPIFRKLRARLYEKYRQYAGEAALEESDSVVVGITPTHVCIR